MSVSADIASCASALGALAGQVSEDQWALVRIIRANLCASAERVEIMESSLLVPDAPRQAAAETCSH